MNSIVDLDYAIAETANGGSCGIDAHNDLHLCVSSGRAWIEGRSGRIHESVCLNRRGRVHSSSLAAAARRALASYNEGLR